MSSCRMAPVAITRPSDTSGDEAARRSIAPSIRTCAAPNAQHRLAHRAHVGGRARPGDFDRALCVQPGDQYIAERCSHAGLQQAADGKARWRVAVHRSSRRGSPRPGVRGASRSVCRSHRAPPRLVPRRSPPPHGLRRRALRGSPQASRSCRCSSPGRPAPACVRGRSAWTAVAPLAWRRWRSGSPGNQARVRWPGQPSAWAPAPRDAIAPPSRARATSSRTMKLAT